MLKKFIVAALFFGIPGIIYQWRKYQWRKQVKKEIRKTAEESGMYMAGVQTCDEAPMYPLECGDKEMETCRTMNESISGHVKDL